MHHGAALLQHWRATKNVGDAAAVGAAGAVEIHHEEHGEDAGPRRASLRSTWGAVAAGGGRRSRAGMAPRSGAKEGSLQAQITVPE